MSLGKSPSLSPRSGMWGHWFFPTSQWHGERKSVRSDTAVAWLCKPPRSCLGAGRFTSPLVWAGPAVGHGIHLVSPLDKGCSKTKEGTEKSHKKSQELEKMSSGESPKELNLLSLAGRSPGGVLVTWRDFLPAGRVYTRRWLCRGYCAVTWYLHTQVLNHCAVTGGAQ